MAKKREFPVLGAPPASGSPAPLAVPTRAPVLAVRPAGGLARPSERPEVVFLRGYPNAHSRRAMQQSLEVCAEALTAGTTAFTAVPWHELRYAHIVALRAKLIESGYAAASTNRHLTALRGLLKTAWLLGQMPADEYQKAISVADVAIRRRTRKGRQLTSAEKTALWQAASAGTGPFRRRDRAILALGLYAGLRREEIAWLPNAAFHAPTGAVTVIGKGDKERTIYLRGEPAQYVAVWAAMVPADGPLIVSLQARGQLGTAISPGGVYAVLQRLGHAARIASFTPHDLRRTFASDLLDAGVDLKTVADLLGHENLNTTKRYDMRGEQAKKLAAGTLTDNGTVREELLDALLDTPDD